MRFEFATATRVIFGPGTLRELGGVASAFGTRALLVTGRDPGRAGRAASELEARHLGVVPFPVAGEPSTQTVAEGTRLAKAERCDFVVSFGGGSAIDAGKAIAAMLSNPGDLNQYLEVVGQGKSLQLPSAPFIAIPTTAGTGSEVTRNAVLACPQKVKVSLRSAHMLPRVALVDPELMLDLPPAVTASTGLDALTQLIEPLVCNRPNPVTDALCLQGIARVRDCLRRAYRNGADAEAREGMALAALYGGVALANAGLGAVHGFAGPIGGMFPAPHGLVCAALLPHVMEANLNALEQQAQPSQVLARFQSIAQILCGDAAAKPRDGVQWVRNLVMELGIPGLARFGLTAADVPVVVEKAMVASSMKANPVTLRREELSAVLSAAIGG